MSPAIEAAWIAGSSGLLGVLVGVTGTVIVGVAGFRNTSAATAAVLRAARDDRIWDKKSAAYQDVMAGALRRRARLEQLLGAALTEDEPSERLEEALSGLDEHAWYDLLGRLGTFGNETVIDAYATSLDATRKAHDCYAEWWKRSKAEKENPGTVIDSGWRDLMSAMEEAAAADQKLETAIRADVHEGRPKAPSAVG
jgi:hypothetical protein